MRTKHLSHKIRLIRKIITLCWIAPFIIIPSENLSAQECDGVLGTEIFFEDFGSGEGPGPSLPPGTTTYTFGAIGGGNYVVTNTIGINGSNWHDAPDHTPDDTNGYCLLFDASSAPGVFYRRTFEDLCANTNYTFSCYAANITRPPSCGGTSIEPNLKFSLFDPSTMAELGSVSTGDIGTTDEMIWNQYSISFNTNQTQQEVLIEITNNAGGGCGNDLALDDFSFSICNPSHEQAFNLCALPGNMIQVGSEIYSTPGVYETIFDLPNSCNDSIVITTLTESIVQNNITQEVILCEGESITINGEIYSSNSIIIDTISSIGNCAFETITYVIEEGSSINTEQVFLCDGDSLFILGNWTSEAGVYQDTFTSMAGCDSVVIFNLEVSDYVVDLNASAITLEPGETFQFLATSNSIEEAAYQWTPSDFFSCQNCDDPIFSPNQSGTYTVIGYDPLAGCTDSLQIDVVVSPCDGSYFPNIFSPNHDGANDNYRPYLSNCIVEVLTFQIFDRWGNKIHSQNNVPVDAPKWDGSFNAKDAVMGVYTFLLNARMFDGSTILYKGDITLMR